jgi:hypothetical protein
LNVHVSLSFQQVEVLLVGRHRRQRRRHHGHRDDGDREDGAAEHDRAAQGATDPTAEARSLAPLDTEGGDLGSCELQRRDARRAS